jgi:hypothetical protein
MILIIIIIVLVVVVTIITGYSRVEIVGINDGAGGGYLVWNGSQPPVAANGTRTMFTDGKKAVRFAFRRQTLQPLTVTRTHI